MHKSETDIPPVVRKRLSHLFGLIEKEFGSIHQENVVLQDKVESLTEKINEKCLSTEQFQINSKQKPPTGQKLKTAEKLKAQTSKIVSSFKSPSAANCQCVKEYSGHRDGLWDVSLPRTGQPVIGTCSADHTARIWNIESGIPLLQYVGHSGSINSIKFHPSKDLALTSSGDQSTHIWQAAVNLDILRDRESDDTEAEDDRVVPVLRTPSCTFTGHHGPVLAADWLLGGDQIITASWDRTAHLYDVETKEIINTLTGHDEELTYTSSHHSQKLVVTASRDTTFRLWDFREAIHSVSVFQGHTDTVTCAIFTSAGHGGEDKLVSGSDDRSIKIWELRNMRSPIITIRADSGVNRFAIATSGVIAVPHDNRQVMLYDMSGQRITRIPRTARNRHRRIVTAVTWSEDNSFANLFSCGFDRLALGWSVHLCKD
ncbi:WD repeat-containing protein 37 [Daktulosphaira vitifoliae]|uniref:WD repeat-containing protein 37 n=1 Tax=Daktulosphaira vitifoliae TaxID=58002 RepID=UPI0021A99825|nr:WD repeat-containing protein 37 [Daktulosphaira vitifoliae]